MLELSKKRAFQIRLRKWWGKNKRDFPWRNTYNSYEILLSEMLLQKTAAYKAVYAYRDITERYPTAQALANAPIDRLENIIFPLGLVKRAKIIKELARILVDDYGGKPPTDKKTLLKLPGVGPYTASAVLCFAHGKREAIVDTNVERILFRFFGITQGLTGTSGFSVLWDAARSLLPKKNFRDFNWALLDFAALVCTFRKPKCLLCPMKSLCDYTEITMS